MSISETALITLVLAVVLVAVAAAPSHSNEYVFQRERRGGYNDYSFIKKVDAGNECYQEINFTVGGKVMTTRDCCDGYVRKDKMGPCLLNDTSPCGNLTCAAVPNAHCELFRKCGKEVALFVHESRIARECHDSDVVDLLSCSGGCIVNPCANKTCPAFKQNEVICFPSGCNCQATWIRLQDKTEVNCLSGETVSKDESYRKRRNTCSK